MGSEAAPSWHKDGVLLVGERPQSRGMGPPKCDSSGCGTPAEPADGESAPAGVAVQGSASQGSASGAATGRSRAEERPCASGRRPRTSAPSQAAPSGDQACPSEAGRTLLAACGRPLQETEDGNQLRCGAGSASPQSIDSCIQEVAPYECLAGLSRNTREHNCLSGRFFRGPDVEFPGT